MRGAQDAAHPSRAGISELPEASDDGRKAIEQRDDLLRLLGRCEPKTADRIEACGGFASFCARGAEAGLAIRALAGDASERRPHDGAPTRVCLSASDAAPARASFSASDDCAPAGGVRVEV